MTEKRKESNQGRIIRDIKNLFELEKKGYHKPVREGNFSSSSYIEYQSNGDRNKTLLIEEYLNKVRPYLKDINNLKKRKYVENPINNSN